MRHLVLTIVLVSLAGLGVVARGATVRFQTQPKTSDLGTTLSVKGALAGLAPRDFVVRSEARGTATIRCPEGGGAARQIAVTAGGEHRFEASLVTAGNAIFGVSTLEPDPSIATCPKGAPEVGDVAFHSVTVRVIQDGKVVLRKT